MKKFLKFGREKQCILCSGQIIWMRADFSSKSMEARKKCTTFFQKLKKKKKTQKTEKPFIHKALSSEIILKWRKENQDNFKWRKTKINKQVL